MVFDGEKEIREKSIVDMATQVNNGLEESAACGSTVVYDKEYGLIFLIYMTGTRTSYGESSGRICLSVFSPTQPTNIRFRRVDEGLGGTRGVLCGCAYLVGPATVRILFATARGEIASYYRDYDFLNDTMSERHEVMLRVGDELLRTDNASYSKLLAAHGYTDVSSASPIINRPCEYNGEIYTCLTVDGEYYPVLCKIKDDILEPFAVCPIKGTYEFRYYIDDTGIHGVFRVPLDGIGTLKTGYAFSPDSGLTWESKLFEDGVQSRPDILPYYGKPLIIYNYFDEHSIENFPVMHHNRNAIKMLYDGKIIFRAFEKYGIVEHFTISIFGDLYMAFSTCEQALSIANGKATWVERGQLVEQGKEEIKWVKIGYLLGEDK